MIPTGIVMVVILADITRKENVTPLMEARADQAVRDKTAHFYTLFHSPMHTGRLLTPSRDLRRK